MQSLVGARRRLISPGLSLSPLPGGLLQVCRAAMERDDVEVVGALCWSSSGLLCAPQIRDHRRTMRRPPWRKLPRRRRRLCEYV